eukprot:COSAG06_NODE_574_length_14079_cov_6.802504_15_plen_158_part_00
MLKPCSAGSRTQQFVLESNGNLHAQYLLRGMYIENGRSFGYQGQLENHKNGFETRRGSNFRPFSFGSSRFSVQPSVENGATTQFESQRHCMCFPDAGTRMTSSASRSRTGRDLRLSCGAATRVRMRSLSSQVRKTPLFEMPFIHKNDNFTKTGSGQT